MKKIYIVLVSIIFSFQLSAQFANNWMLGWGYSLNFSTPTPSVGWSPITWHQENTSTISDASGNLLFYTSGEDVWDKNHNVMPNGSGLIGDWSAGQCAIITPFPCNPNKYIIFHNTHAWTPGYLSYSVVDMSLNAGLGDVAAGQKNISLGSGWTEKQCVYYNSTLNCFWLLAHKFMSDQFVAFKVDATSIAVTSVTSSIGSIHNCSGSASTNDAQGQLTFSPDGSKVVNTLACQDKIEFFDFDINTGILSNSISIPGDGSRAWGAAFSPDSKKVYVDALLGCCVYQYDISVYNASAILSSSVNVYNTGSTGYKFGFMELGPNGKIYIARPNTNYVACINSPNSLGAACNFSIGAINTGTALAKWGLSRIAYNIPSSFPITSIPITSGVSSVSCNGFSNGTASISPVTAGTYYYSWSPGGYTTSAVSGIPAGNYTASISDGSCAITSTVISIIEPPAINVSVDTLQMCLNSSGTINSVVSGGTPAYTYSWSNGASTPAIIVSPSVTTTYTLNIIDANGCNGVGTTTVTVSACTGIQSNYNNIGISISPNPFSENINIQSAISIDEIKILNVLGTTVKQAKLNNGNFDTHELPNGVYSIELYDKNKLVTKKRVVKTN